VKSSRKNVLEVQVVEDMKCPFGCKPTRDLTNKEGAELVSAVRKLEVDNTFRTIKSQ
jgi:hypothetical protein